MAPHSAVPSPSYDPAGYPADPPAPHLYPQPAIPPRSRIVWPWPVFLLGIAALVGVWFGRPYWKPTDGDRVKRDLAELRTLLSRQSPDLGRAVMLGQKSLDAGGSYPQYVGESHYLMGCVHLKKAEDAADPTEDWQQARKHFEQAELAGVPEADQPRLALRLGKALHLSKGDPRQALVYLRKGDDPEATAERWQLIAECCLRQSEPDLKGAIDATNNQIPHLLQGDGRVRAQAYQRLAELHLKTNQVALARKALEEIKSADSQELYDSSRVLLARCHQADGNFALAVPAWEQVRAKARPPIDRGTICYELGYCYWKAGRPEEAKKIWDEAQSLGSEAAQASLIRKAEMQLADLANRAEAVPILEDAFKAIHRSSDFRNALYPKTQAEQLLEKTCQEFKAANDWASAGKVAELLTRLSGAAKGKELAAEIALAWGLALQKDAQGKSGQAAKHAEEEAAKQFRTAASLAAEIQTPDRPPSEQAEWLLRAAKYYLKCTDKVDVQNAVALLEKVPKSASGVEGEVNFLKAVAWEQLGESEKAIEGYQACLSTGHPQSHRARYQLARLLVNQPAASREERTKNLDRAAEELTPNLDPAVRESHPEEAEQSTLLIGHIAYAKRDYVKAESLLATALRQYPNHTDSISTRFMMGRCFWFQAGKESPKVHDAQLPQPERDVARKRMNELLEKARQIFEPLEDELQKREQDQKLSDVDRHTLRQASFAAAECYFFMENFPEAVRRYNMLRLRYARQVEEMISLAQLWQCYTVYLDRREQGDATLGAMRELLKSLPDEAFDGSADIYKREYWADWIQRASKPAETDGEKKTGG